MTTITVSKRSHTGAPMLVYEGELVARGATWVCLDAIFTLQDKVKDYVVFRQGDLFTEWHYSDRWYNIFRLQDVDDGRLKGWYCNISRPAVITETTVVADDLALDLFVNPNGDLLVLDEDEFLELDLPRHDIEAALTAVETLKALVRDRRAPFDEIVG